MIAMPQAHDLVPHLAATRKSCQAPGLVESLMCPEFPGVRLFYFRR